MGLDYTYQDNEKPNNGDDNGKIHNQPYLRTSVSGRHLRTGERPGGATRQDGDPYVQ